MEDVRDIRMTCPFCNYVWQPIKYNPKRCPNCKTILNPPKRKPKPIKPIPIIIEKKIEEKNFTLDEPTEQEIEQSINEVKEKGEDFSFSK